jgi:hypothetical protein
LADFEKQKLNILEFQGFFLKSLNKTCLKKLAAKFEHQKTIDNIFS